VTAKGADIKTCDTTWHPEFGLSIPNKKLIFNFNHSEASFILTRVK
jgi:hypothetical protein